MKALLILMTLATVLAFSITVNCQELEQRIKALDGTLTKEEVEALNSKVETEYVTVYSKKEGDLISIAVKSAPHFVASVCLSNSDAVLVLHASSALGQLRYVPKNGSWDPVGKFVWEVRDTSMEPEAIRQRIDYFNKNGWVANTTPMGTAGETEFLVRADLLDGKDPRFAVGIMPASNPENIISAPPERDGCGDRMLVSGNSERLGMKFDKKSWIRIE